jgi:hypothetical protein
MPDVLIWLEPLIVNVNLDVLEMDELVVSVHHLKWMAVNSRSVVPMLNADLKMALDNVIVHLTFHMATPTKVVRHHQETKNAKRIQIVPLTNPAFAETAQILVR